MSNPNNNFDGNSGSQQLPQAPFLWSPTARTDADSTVPVNENTSLGTSTGTRLPTNRLTGALGDTSNRGMLHVDTWTTRQMLHPGLQSVDPGFDAWSGEQMAQGGMHLDNRMAYMRSEMEASMYGHGIAQQGNPQHGAPGPPTALTGMLSMPDFASVPSAARGMLSQQGLQRGADGSRSMMLSSQAPALDYSASDFAASPEALRNTFYASGDHEVSAAPTHFPLGREIFFSDNQQIYQLESPGNLKRPSGPPSMLDALLLDSPHQLRRRSLDSHHMAFSDFSTFAMERARRMSDPARRDWAWAADNHLGNPLSSSLLDRSDSSRLHKGKRLVDNSPFPVKLHSILSNIENEDCIVWLPHGKAWRITNPTVFENRVLPRHFRSSRYASFMRQVNGWGFRRILTGPDQNGYYNKNFVRGRPELCAKMQRVSKKQGSSPASIDVADAQSPNASELDKTAKEAPESAKLNAEGTPQRLPPPPGPTSKARAFASRSGMPKPPPGQHAFSRSSRKDVGPRLPRDTRPIQRCESFGSLGSWVDSLDGGPPIHRHEMSALSGLMVAAPPVATSPPMPAHAMHPSHGVPGMPNPPARFVSMVGHEFPPQVAASSRVQGAGAHIPSLSEGPSPHLDLSVPLHPSHQASGLPKESDDSLDRKPPSKGVSRRPSGSADLGR